MRRKDEAGQALLIVAAAFVVLMLAAGLSIDMGYLRYEKRRLQMAADSAAIAGANSCKESSGCEASYITEGQTSAAYNGFDHTSPQTTVAINNPPQSGPHSSTTDAVEAIITQNVPTFFMKIFGPSFSSFPVTARAVAYPGPGTSCIYALSSMALGGTKPSVEAPACTITDTGNLTVGGPNDAGDFLEAQAIIYGGSYGGGGMVSPSPIHVAPAGNPLASLPTNPGPPGPASPCPGLAYCPGYYYYPNGLSIGSSVNFPNSSPYVIGGSGLSISGSGTVTGTGVTFYITSGGVSINYGTDYSSCATTPNFGSTIQLSAPTDTGILFVQNQSQASTITLNNGDTCNSNGNNTTASYLWGLLYFPYSQLTLIGTGLGSDNGCSSVPRYTIVVASVLLFGTDNTMDFRGGDSNFGVSDCPPGTVTPFPFPSGPLYDPIKDAVLVE